MQKAYLISIIACSCAIMTNISVLPAAADEDQLADSKMICSVKRAIALANDFVEKGFQQGEGSVSHKNMAEAEKYYAQAEDLINNERASLLLAKGWVASKLEGMSASAQQMLQEGLKLEPNNPQALYKVAFVEWETYFADLVDQMSRTQKAKLLPDGNEVGLAPICLTYSADRDNTRLEHARELLEKAVAIDPTLAVAYEMLGRIHGFKGDEPSVNYNVLFLKHRDSIDMELLFYSAETRNQMIKNALQSVKLHAPEKLKELGLEEGYAPSPTPSPAS